MNVEFSAMFLGFLTSDSDGILLGSKGMARTLRTRATYTPATFVGNNVLTRFGHNLIPRVLKEQHQPVVAPQGKHGKISWVNSSLKMWLLFSNQMVQLAQYILVPMMYSPSFSHQYGLFVDGIPKAGSDRATGVDGGALSQLNPLGFAAGTMLKSSCGLRQKVRQAEWTTAFVHVMRRAPHRLQLL